MKSIHEEIVDVICNVMNVPGSINLSSDTWDTPLTGDPFYLSAIEMTYLFFEVEKIFNVRISSEHLTNYGFNSVNAIAEIVRVHVALYK